MRNYENLVLSKYAKILYWNDLCIIGNIAVDGRWIKIPYIQYEHIINQLDKKCFSFDENNQNIIDSLINIHVLLSESDFQKELLICPKDITVELTTQCNLKCKHCSYSFGGTEYKEMPTNTIISLAKWCQLNNIKRITLTGGEPFCRKDINSIIENIRQNYSGSLEILTNGTLITENIIPTILKNVNYLHISLDGFDEESVAIIRGRTIYSKVIQLINNLHKEGFYNISLSCIDTGNLENINHFKELAYSLGVKDIIRQLNLKGRASDNFDYENTELLKSLTQKGTTMKCLCNHAYSVLFIDTVGNLFPCAALRDSEYNIGQISFSNNNLQLKSNVNIPIVDTIDECKKCFVRYFCSDTCISQNNAIYYSTDIRKKRCEYRKDLLFDVVWRGKDC